MNAEKTNLRSQAVPTNADTTTYPNCISDNLPESSAIQAKIFQIREIPVMLDRDLAKLYGVETKALNQAVRRNIERFPTDFMFRLTKEECLRSQIVTLNGNRGKHLKYLPFVFTENGIAMLSGLLRSRAAIEVNIQIMRAFVSMRKALVAVAPMQARLDAVEHRQISDQARNEERFDAIFAKMSEDDVPEHQVFYQGKFWDARSLLFKFIRRAKKELIVIDAYLGVGTLDMLAKRTRGTKIEIFTHSNGELAETDFEAFGRQYGNLAKSICSTCHDRFIIVDKCEIYAIGASLKDAGRLTFGIAKMGAPIIPGLLAHLRNATTERKVYGN